MLRKYCNVQVTSLFNSWAAEVFGFLKQNQFDFICGVNAKLANCEAGQVKMTDGTFKNSKPYINPVRNATCKWRGLIKRRVPVDKTERVVRNYTSNYHIRSGAINQRQCLSRTNMSPLLRHPRSQLRHGLPKKFLL